MPTISLNEFLKQTGTAPDQVKSLGINGASTTPPEIKSQGYSFGELGQDIKQTGTGIMRVIKERGGKLGKILDAYGKGEQRALSTGFQTATNLATSVTRTGAELLKGAAKTLLPQSAETKLKESLAEVAKGVLNTETAQKLIRNYEEMERLDPVMARNTVALAEGGEFLLEFLGLKAGSKAVSATAKGAKDITKKGTDIVSDTITTGSKKFKPLLDDVSGRPLQINSVDDLIKKADDALKPAEVLAKTAKATSKPSLLERWAGVSADIKNRIAGKHDKLKEYFDVAHARNNFDTLPTPLEYAAKNVDNAVTRMQDILDDVGSNIGSFRKKVATYKAPVDAVKKIEGTFNQELKKLNLEIFDGSIRQIPGTVKRINSEAELRVLRDLLDNLTIIKQSPDLQRLIDLRNLFDSKINFAKTAREVSNSLDPLSRQVRTQIKNVAAGIVGKTEAGNLAKYSDFIDAFNTLKSFTDRKAGAEFLLKQVLSERGAAPREIIQTIKEITGIDLMDDAVMSSIATDLIGNSRQKGVFRQEITKAGLDAARVLKGDGSGAIELMINLGKKALVDTEKQFLKAARSK